ncbi:MAG: hypothetical protein GY834_04125 [Bacteroidetes bacterium]|nr:hypothetical protein [Bacteroidota bacterium]
MKEDNSPLRKGKNGTFIFIHINKTGGTSVAKIIGLPRKRHLHVKEVISIIGEKEFNKAFVCCVVRNPWDKVVSHYKYRVKTNRTNMANNHISFKEWVKCTYGKDKNSFYYDKPKMFAIQSDWIKDNNGVIRVSNILRFESLSNDFKVIAEYLGIQNELPYLNATRKESYIRYYDKETEEIVRSWFKEDIERFKFEFESRVGKGKFHS